METITKSEIEDFLEEKITFHYKLFKQKGISQGDNKNVQLSDECKIYYNSVNHFKSYRALQTEIM